MYQTLYIINIIVLAMIVAYAIYRLSRSYQQRYRNVVVNTQDPYDPHAWYFKLPDSVIQHLEACYEGDERKVYLMSRAIELSIEHFVAEMADDAECARIIEERVYQNPKGTVPFDLETYQRDRNTSPESDTQSERDKD